MEPTTTDPTPDAGAAEAAQPESVEQQAAATEPAEQPTTTEDAQAETPADEGDAGDDNLAWLQKKGIDPTDPEAVAKVAKMYRDAEKAMHDSTKKASELERALSGGEQSTPTSQLDIPQEWLEHPVLGQIVERLGELEAGQTQVSTVQAVNSFFTSNPEAKQFEKQMASIVTDNPAIGQLVKSGYLSYDQLLAMAKGSDSGRDDKLRTEGGREALQTVADKQQGRSLVGSATKSEFSKDTKRDDDFLSGFNKPF